MPGIKPRSTAELQTNLTNKPNTVFTCILKYSVLQNVKLSFPNCWNSISQCFYSQNSECQFILFQYTNVFLCVKFGDLKPTIDEKQRPQIWTCFRARCRLFRNKIQQENCDFVPTKCFINVNWSSWTTDCEAKNLKPQFMLQDGRGDQPSKTWENAVMQGLLTLQNSSCKINHQTLWN